MALDGGAWTGDVLVERGDTGTVELILFHGLDAVALLDGDDDLDLGLVAVAILDEVEVPGVEREVSLDVRACFGMVEGAVGEDGGELFVLCGGVGEASNHDGRHKKDVDCFFQSIKV